MPTRPAAVKFTKARETIWNGNGFGTSGACWDATVNGEAVAHFDPDAPHAFSIHGERIEGGTHIDGAAYFGKFTPTAWKAAVRNKYAA